MDADEELTKLDAGQDVDLSYRRGIVQSSKTAFAYIDGRYGVLHEINGHVTNFTRSGMREVLQGSRDPWIADVE